MIDNIILITSPSLDLNKNVSGISSITSFIINNNQSFRYLHFELGRHDFEKRNILWLIRILKAWIKWVFTINSKRIVLIHFNIALEKNSIIRDAPLIRLAQVFHKRIVIHLHGGKYLEKQNAPKLIKAIIISILSGKEPKIVFSMIEKELIEKKFHADNVFILPNTVDLKEAKKFIRNNHVLLPIRLLYIGRIVEGKGIEYIYEALKTLKAKNIPLEFIMAGNGQQKNEYIQKFSALLGTDFEYKGVISGEIKTEQFKKCQIFLLPSLYEGLPISLIESMSFGLVPIVTDVGSVGTVVKNAINGIIVGKQSSEAISVAIEKLINDNDLLLRLGSNAKEFIIGHFDPQVYIKRLNEIYEFA